MTQAPSTPAVTTATPEPLVPGTPEYNAAMIAKADGLEPKAEVVAVVAEARPDWLPEKFKTPADMAAAYAALEKKQSAPEVKPVAVPVTTEAAAEVTPEQAAATAAAAGVDFDVLTTTYAANGELSAADYEGLAAKGIPADVVDAYIAGQKSIAETQLNSVMATVGGKEAFDAMSAWASTSMADADLKAFNELAGSGDTAKMKIALGSLQAAYKAANGSEPKLISVNSEPVAGDVFRSNAEVVKAMSSPAYKTDPAYRAQVVAKLGRSSAVF